MLVVVLGAGSVVADVLAARQRAAAAADLGALAAAPAAVVVAAQRLRGRRVGRAGERARSLRECRIRDGDVWVTASALPRSRAARWVADVLLGGTGAAGVRTRRPALTVDA